MTTELQNQINASSLKIENWQIKKENLRIQDENDNNSTYKNTHTKHNKAEGIIDKLHSNFINKREGLYKFIEAL